MLKSAGYSFSDSLSCTGSLDKHGNSFGYSDISFGSSSYPYKPGICDDPSDQGDWQYIRCSYIWWSVFFDDSLTA